MLLRIAFTVAPILFGLDKFAEVLTNDWTRYLSTEFNDILPGSAADAMHIVGVVEIAAGVVVAVSPRFGGLLVAGCALDGGVVGPRERVYSMEGCVHVLLCAGRREVLT